MAVVLVPGDVLPSAPGVRMWARIRHEYLVFIKRECGLQWAEKHPLSPPFLELSGGFAYVSEGQSPWGGEIGSRESN